MHVQLVEPELRDGGAHLVRLVGVVGVVEVRQVIEVVDIADIAEVAALVGRLRAPPLSMHTGLGSETGSSSHTNSRST